MYIDHFLPKGLRPGLTYTLEDSRLMFVRRDPVTKTLKFIDVSTLDIVTLPLTIQILLPQHIIVL